MIAQIDGVFGRALGSLRISLRPIYEQQWSGAYTTSLPTRSRSAATGRFPRPAASTMPQRLFSPSLGLAYRLTDTFVIRAGYGITQVPLGMENAINLIYPTEFTATTPVAQLAFLGFDPGAGCARGSAARRWETELFAAPNNVDHDDFSQDVDLALSAVVESHAAKAIHTWVLSCRPPMWPTIRFTFVQPSCDFSSRVS